jgi:hypothetical protein
MCEAMAIAHERLTADNGVRDWIAVAQERIEEYSNARKNR